ncbi:hypothetical protein ACFL4L_06775 [bacterium]
MSILSQLSSRCGDRTEQSNVKVAFLCLEEPGLLDEIKQGLHADDARMAGDCAEVMTKVAEEDPSFIVPFADDLIVCLAIKKARVRWESMHALALIANLIPEKIEFLLPQIDQLIHEDKSVIVQHCGILALGKYASSGKDAAEKAYPYLKKAVFVRDSKFAHHAMDGLIYIMIHCPDYHEEIHEIANQFLNHKRVSIRKASKRLLQAMGEC